MITIKDLREAKKIIVEEWAGVTYCDGDRSGGHKIAEYIFEYSKSQNVLYIYGDVFGEEKYKVINSLPVLFAIAKGHTIKVDVNKRMNLDIWNPVITIVNE